MFVILLFLLVIYAPLQIVHLIYLVRGRRPSVRSLVTGSVVGALLVLVGLEPTMHFILNGIPYALGAALGLDVESLWFDIFAGVALYEEALKFGCLWLVIAFQRQVAWGDRPPAYFPVWDVVIPALWIGSAFAVLENCLYLAWTLAEEPGELLNTAVLRIIFPTTAHLTFAVFMGVLYGFSLQRFQFAWLLLPVALAVPTLLHGTHNLIAMLSVHWSVLLIYDGAIAAAAYALLRYTNRQERSLQATEPQPIEYPDGNHRNNRLD